MTAVVQVTDSTFRLSEGPIWDAARHRLLWVDIDAGRVIEGRLDRDRLVTTAEHHFDGHVGAIACSADGALLVAETRRLTRLGPEGARTSTPDVLDPDDDRRLNDGTCDDAGRFLVGTLSLRPPWALRPDEQRRQQLIQLGPDGTTVLDDDLGLANGMGFSPDGTALYSIDSIPGCIWVRDYDQLSGRSGPRRLLVPPGHGTPDGMCVDADGNLWVAIWDRGEIRCHSASGHLLHTIAVPAPHPTSVTFGGPDLDQLLITSEQHEHDPSDLPGRELSGALFCCRPGVVGLPARTWSGDLPTVTAPLRIAQTLTPNPGEHP